MYFFLPLAEFNVSVHFFNGLSFLIKSIFCFDCTCVVVFFYSTRHTKDSEISMTCSFFVSLKSSPVLKLSDWLCECCRWSTMWHILSTNRMWAWLTFLTAVLFVVPNHELLELAQQLHRLLEKLHNTNIKSMWRSAAALS